MTTYSNTTNGKAVDERETDIAARADAPARPGEGWLPATFHGSPAPGAMMRVDPVTGASTYSSGGVLYMYLPVEPAPGASSYSAAGAPYMSMDAAPAPRRQRRRRTRR